MSISSIRDNRKPTNCTDPRQSVKSSTLPAGIGGSPGLRAWLTRAPSSDRAAAVEPRGHAIAAAWASSALANHCTSGCWWRNHVICRFAKRIVSTTIERSASSVVISPLATATACR